MRQLNSMSAYLDVRKRWESTPADRWWESPSLAEMLAPPPVEPEPIPSDLWAAQCPRCGYRAYLPLESIAEAGSPACPCGAGSMDCDAFDDFREEAEGFEAPRILRDRWVTVRAIHHCDRCRGELPHGEQARYRVGTLAGELFSTYTCDRCENPSHYAGALGSDFIRG